MLRDLSIVLTELQDGLTVPATRAGVRLNAVDMTLPMDMLVVLRDGGCVLLADVPRSFPQNTWRGQGSRLHLRWEISATEDEAIA